MTLDNPTPPARTAAPARAARETLGRVIAVSGAQVTVGLIADRARQRVARHRRQISRHRQRRPVIVGMITEIAERPLRDQDPNCRSTARIDLVGEIKASAAGAAYFQRGVTEYPMIGEPAMLMTDRELRLIYNGANAKPSNIGTLQQDPTIPAQHRHRAARQQALRHARHHRRRQVERRRHPPVSKFSTSGRTCASS